MRVDAPFDACVVIDPDNEVIEEFERSGAMIHNPVCPPIPDLTITNVFYDSRGGGMLQVTVKNIGTNPLSSRSVALRTALPDGTSLYLSSSWPNISLGRNESHLFTLSGVSESIRDQMQQGYVVTVNPEGTIVENNMDNNDYEVHAMNSLRVRLMAVEAPWDYRNSAEFDINVHTINGGPQRPIAHWHLSDIDWSTCYDENWGGCLSMYRSGLGDISTYWFDIYGDEILEIVATGTHRGGFSRSIVLTYLPENNWDANGWGSMRDCSDWSGAHRDGGDFEIHDSQHFGFSLQVCQESP